MSATAENLQSTNWLALLGQTLAEEHHYQPEIKGRIPAGLNGVLYRNGPGRFDRGGMRKSTALDGDGMIQAFHFVDGKVSYQNKFTRTEKYLEEEKAGKLTQESWTTRAPGGFIKNLGLPSVKSQASVTAIYRDDKLYVFDEVEAPYIVDGDNLETKGQEAIGTGNLKNFKAHTKIDAGNGDWILFGADFGRVMNAHFVVQSKTGDIKSQFTVEMPRACYMHDFFATENYIILNMHPAELGLMPLLTGVASFREALKWKADKENLLVILHKSGKEKPIVVEAPSSWMWHSYNAYEEKGMIIADFVGYEEPDHFLGEEAALKAIMSGHMGKADAKGKPRRYEINLATKSARETILMDEAFEFPMIHPTVACHSHKIGYTSKGTGNNIFHTAIAKLNFETGATDSFDFGPMTYVGEPIVVPDPTHPTDEEKGWLLALALDGNTGKSFLAVLDASALSAGPVASILLSHHTPISFHGFWRQI